MPKPQVFTGQRIAHSGATAMMDVSDGLAISLYDMSEASGVGFDLRENHLPLLPIADAKRYFLYGGGDYGISSMEEGITGFCSPSRRRNL